MNQIRGELSTNDMVRTRDRRSVTGAKRERCKSQKVVRGTGERRKREQDSDGNKGLEKKESKNLGIKG